jgi:hypothetical protein
LCCARAPGRSAARLLSDELGPDFWKHTKRYTTPNLASGRLENIRNII